MDYRCDCGETVSTAVNFCPACGAANPCNPALNVDYKVSGDGKVTRSGYLAVNGGVVVLDNDLKRTSFVAPQPPAVTLDEMHDFVMQADPEWMKQHGFA